MLWIVQGLLDSLLITFSPFTTISVSDLNDKTFLTDSSKFTMLCNVTTRARRYRKGTFFPPQIMFYDVVLIDIIKKGFAEFSVSHSRVTFYFFLSAKACGVDFEVKAFCAENVEEKIHKRYNISQWLPTETQSNT